MMKSRVILFAISALLLSSCGGHVEQGARTADEFIEAYMAADYEAAASYCNDYVREAVDESAAMLEELDEALRESFMELSAEMKVHRTSVFEHSKDSITVDYDILIPNEVEPIHNAVIVAYNAVLESWYVVDVK